MKQTHYILKIGINVILLTFCVVIFAHAEPIQSRTEITEAIKKFVVEQNVPFKNIQVTLNVSKKQFEYPQCTKQLEISTVPGAKLIGRTNFTVSCPAPQQWKTQYAVHIDGKINVLITSHPILQRALIKNSDLEYAPRMYSELNRGYYESANNIKNMEALRNIKAGQILTPGLIKAQNLVLRGQHITIIVQNGELNLTTKGEALMDGLQGQTIKVKNLNSKKLLYAKVISSGVVKVNF
jgi:flagella basal body P-ring formation protein FlgA